MSYFSKLTNQPCKDLIHEWKLVRFAFACYNLPAKTLTFITPACGALVLVTVPSSPIARENSSNRKANIVLRVDLALARGRPSEGGRQTRKMRAEGRELLLAGRAGVKIRPQRAALCSYEG
jgi:hypothetical protein